MTPRRWRADAQVLRQLAQEIEHTPKEARLPCGVECNTAFDIRVAHALGTWLMADATEAAFMLTDLLRPYTREHPITGRDQVVLMGSDSVEPVTSSTEEAMNLAVRQDLDPLIMVEAAIAALRAEPDASWCQLARRTTIQVLRAVADRQEQDAGPACGGGHG